MMTLITADEILQRYEDGSLLKEDDATLFETAFLLENLQRTLFELSNFSETTTSERVALLKRCRVLNEVAQGIINLLLLRYGCND